MPLTVEQPLPHVTQVTIDNTAKRNAMSRAMLAELADLWDALDRSACRCVVLTGAGDRAFCAGADIGGDLTVDAGGERTVDRALLKAVPFSRPVVAAVNGDCAGGGVELLLSTDIRFAAPHARFGLPEVCWSIYPFGGATVKLVQQVGHVHAMDLLLTGRLVDAAFAERIGLVNEVVPADEVLERALATAERIAANSPSAVQAVKYQVSDTIGEQVRARETVERRLGDAVRTGPHFEEGVRAFREKRRPDYGA